MPAWCVFDVRMGIFPGQDINEAKAEIEAVLMDAATENAFLRDNQPRIVYHGFLADGYALSEDTSDAATQAIAALDAAHETVNNGASLDRAAITATTDSRFFGLYANTPALVYGPHAEAIHGFNERVSLESMAPDYQSHSPVHRRLVRPRTTIGPSHARRCHRLHRPHAHRQGLSRRPSTISKAQA